MDNGLEAILKLEWEGKNWGDGKEARQIENSQLGWLVGTIRVIHLGL